MRSLRALGAALGLDTADFLPLAPGVGLVHALGRAGGAVVLRWAVLPRAVSLVPGAPAVDAVVVMTAPLGESGRSLRLVARLRGCFADPAVLPRLRAATSREDLVRALRAAEAAAGESPLAAWELFALLGAARDGLSTVEAERRRRLVGPNRIERVRRVSLLARALEQFTSFFALLLWVGGAGAFAAGMAQLGWAIFAVIVVNGVFSFLQEYRAERAVEALQQLLPPEITVLRDGEAVRRPAVDVVPGDVVRLAEGDQVPADAALLPGQMLRVDQSPLTGESHPVFKLASPDGATERVPFLERHDVLFAGTHVVAGDASAVVIATGMATEIGAVARLTQAVVEDPSPLQQEMRRVTRIVTLLAVSFGAGFFALGVGTGLLSLPEGLLFAIGVIVANVPEGLLPTLTLALALGVQRMARQRSLVKRLSSLEALGATTVVCTDKTGTLTQNRMIARAACVGDRPIVLDEGAGAIDGEVRALLEAGALASVATADRGDPTEVAIVAAAAAAGVQPEKLRAEHELLSPYPFDSFRKRMTLVRASKDGVQAYVKGAPRETLALCIAERGSAGTAPLTEERRRAILAEHDRLAADGLRLLAVAVRALPAALVGAPASAVERDLVFLGVVALWDPPRPEVAEAVAVCHRAGIRVVMITGDYGLTARSIARQIGLDVGKIVSGEEVEHLAPDALRELCADRSVLFARTSPAHKLAIVSALRERGEVVAVTGDGVNDAPALKVADIGVAMGRRGTEVAKQAADMVITDDNFTSIVSAIREGRAIYANMGKFVTYIFASNVPELVPFLAFVLAGIPLPLTVMQILAVDLGTDLVPALALGAEPPERDVMARPPRARTARLLGPTRLLRSYGFLGAAEAALSLGAFFWTYWLAGWRPGLAMAASGPLYQRATTMAFVGIVATQVGNVFACRTDRESIFTAGLFTNPLVLVGIAAEAALVSALILVPPLAAVFGLAPLAPREWAILCLFPPTMLLLEEARKAMIRGAGIVNASRRQPCSCRR